MCAIFLKENTPNCINFMPRKTWVFSGSLHRILTKNMWHNHVKYCTSYLLLEATHPDKFSGLEQQLWPWLQLGGSSVSLSWAPFYGSSHWSKMGSLKCLAVVWVSVGLPCFSLGALLAWSCSRGTTFQKGGSEGYKAHSSHRAAYAAFYLWKQVTRSPRFKRWRNRLHSLLEGAAKNLWPFLIYHKVCAWNRRCWYMLAFFSSSSSNLAYFC